MKLRSVPRALTLALLTLACNTAPSLTPEQKAMLKPYILDAPPPGMSAYKIDFDHKAEVVGILIDPHKAIYPSGTKVTVTVIWHCLAKIDDGYQLFAHLNGPGGELVQNLDES